ncbi:cell division protein FtsY [Thermanaerothrix daxensis]|uniref:Signal recognition particle receptor FtsY n=1 Tax=Thermanaerothrix daxensis TaxID=869279 RepID=A0A0P6XY17_9CHLR|nr:signal recognition particle-docking protein FtsY [Thermanaerothrix daxensis]KPL84493.1 cell division protein FtsY [Thermanaerothrix daxensis]
MIDLINKWKQGLERTRKATFGRLAAMLGVSEIDTDTWEDLEALLLQADLGVETSQQIIESLRQRVHQQGLTRTSELQQALKEELLKRLDEPPPINLEMHQPAVILIVGVNGSGKTTTIAKLAYWFKRQNKKVLLVAADTFRAAAVDQLQVWAERLDLPIVAGQPNADPGAVAYDGIQAALARKADVALVDTAGRLHTRYNLMEELKKVHRVVGKALPGAPHAVWLVLDATTGQNALQQARAFKDAVNVNGIILAKLDSSARGGMAFAIQRTLGIPILFVGLGEKPEDLEIFNPEAFVQGILEG